MDSFQFLNGFFAGCSTEQFIELSYIHPDKVHPIISKFIQIGNDKALKIELSNAGVHNRMGYGIYFGVCPRIRAASQGRRGSEADVDTIVGFWGDLDSIKEGRSIDDDLAALSASAAPPSMCVLSGGGVQPYWMLGKPYQMTDDDRRNIKAALKGIGAQHQSDPAVAEFARVLRVPGFINTKPGRDEAPTKFIPPAEKRRYTVDQLLAFKPAEEPRRVIPFQRPTDQTEQDTVDLAQRALNALNTSRREDYHEWVGVGAALTELGSIGLSLWENWSAGDTKYRPGECARKWDSFKRTGGNARTIGSLFYMADHDAGTHWRPLPASPRAAERNRMIDDAVDVVWDSGLPVAVRAALNLYAGSAVAPVIELWFEGIAKGKIPADEPTTVDCLFTVGQELGRKLTKHTIRTGLKQGAESSGGAFLRNRAHDSITIQENTLDPLVMDPCAQNQINCDPCREPGRVGELYELRSRSEILRALAVLSFPGLVREQFPIEGDLIAPIMPEFVASLGVVNAEQVAEDLDARYHEPIVNQDGFKDAMRRARKGFNDLLTALKNPQIAPIPDGWTYSNSTEYKACCARAIVEAAGGETQHPRGKLCKLIGCVDKMLKTILDRAGILMLKDQVVDRAIGLLEHVSRLKREYDFDMKGFPVGLVSTLCKEVFSLKKRGVLSWAESELEKGATLSVRYRQANKQILVEDLQPKKVKKAAEVEAEPEVAPVLQPALLPPDPEPMPLPHPVEPEAPREPRPPKVKKESWEVRWIKKLADRAAPVSPGTIDTETGEIAPVTVQLALDALLASPGQKPILAPPIVDADPLLDPGWLASIGATVTQVVYHEQPERIAA